jgi:hypothetical protein
MTALETLGSYRYATARIAVRMDALRLAEELAEARADMEARRAAVRDELAKLLEDWALQIGAVNELHATEFAEKLLAEGWSK